MKPFDKTRTRLRAVGDDLREGVEAVTEEVQNLSAVAVVCLAVLTICMVGIVLLLVKGSIQ